MARLERNAGDAGEASTYYEQAVTAFVYQRDPTHELLERLEYARLLLTAAPKVPETLAKARTQLETAARQAASVNEFQARWRVEYEFGLLSEIAGDAVGAAARYKNAVARLEEVRASLSQQGGRQSLVDNEVVQDLYARLTRLQTDAGNAEEAWQTVEHAKARSFVEQLGQRHSGPSATPELKEILELEKSILNVKVELAADAQSQNRSGRDPNVLHSELYDLERRFSLARQQESLLKTRAGQTVALASISLTAAQRFLPNGTTLLEYAFLPDGMTAFLVTRAGTKQMRWKLDRRELERTVKEDLLPMLAGNSTQQEVDAALAALSRMIVDPVAKNLPKGQRLIVIPTGFLNYVPFEALKLPGGESMIDAFTISYLPSASALQFIDAQKPLPGKLFLGAIGNVSANGAAALPGTLAEVDAIGKLEHDAARVTGVDFTHDAARDALTKFDVVHFATHGDVDANAPLFSALLTSSTPLFLYEIQALKLQARMVVLSACRTGKGRVQGGDEVAGFTRTLLLAGADTVVASLWDVNDASTAELMSGFYRALNAGQTAAAALRSSMLEVRGKFPHPKFWAAFVMTGI
jgi:CHAT domain-containing protein